MILTSLGVWLGCKADDVVWANGKAEGGLGGLDVGLDAGRWRTHEVLLDRPGPVGRS